MDAREFFHNVVMPNYTEFVRSPTDIRLLWNALVSMNTVAEYLALERLGYPQIGPRVIYLEAQRIRRLSGLAELKYCAETFKHVRKIRDRGSSEFTTIATSTGVSPDDQATWNVDGKDLVKVVHTAFATLKEIPELK